MEDYLERFYIEEVKNLKSCTSLAIAFNIQAAEKKVSQIDRLIQIDDSVRLIS